MPKKATAVAPATNGAKATIEITAPYMAGVTLQGTSDILFHRWNNEAVAEKAGAAKGSKAKKVDDLESYVYRDSDGVLCLPGEYVRQSLIHAAKYRQDPRSPRKSAMDLFKAGVVALTDLAPLGTTDWDYEHRARVQIQRSGITRVRPALQKGWRCDLEFLINLPEYISPDLFVGALVDAGRLVGVGDFRPTYGRFAVVNFQVIGDEVCHNPVVANDPVGSGKYRWRELRPVGATETKAA